MNFCTKNCCNSFFELKNGFRRLSGAEIFFNVWPTLGAGCWKSDLGLEIPFLPAAAAEPPAKHITCTCSTPIWCSSKSALECGAKLTLTPPGAHHHRRASANARHPRGCSSPTRTMSGRGSHSPMPGLWHPEKTSRTTAKTVWQTESPCPPSQRNFFEPCTYKF